MSRNRQLSLGIVGLGAGWEPAYRPALERLGERAVVTAVMGPRWKATAETALTLGLRHISSLRELMRQENDGVLVTEAGWLGWFPLRVAIESGRNLYTPLPACEDYAPLEGLHAAAQSAGVLAVPEMRLRYTPATLRLRELLATELGPVEEIEVRSLSPALMATPRVVLELIDWCRVVLGCFPRDVRAGETPGPRSGDSLQTIELGFEPAGSKSGRVRAAIMLPEVSGSGVTHAAVPGDAAADTWPLEFSIRCKHGEARLEAAAQLRWREGGREQIESLSTDRTAVSVAVDHFARRLAGGLIPVPDLGDVCLAARVVTRAAQSRATGGTALECRPV